MKRWNWPGTMSEWDCSRLPAHARTAWSLWLGEAARSKKNVFPDKDLSSVSRRAAEPPFLQSAKANQILSITGKIALQLADDSADGALSSFSQQEEARRGVCVFERAPAADHFEFSEKQRRRALECRINTGSNCSAGRKATPSNKCLDSYLFLRCIIARRRHGIRNSQRGIFPNSPPRAHRSYIR